MEKVNLIKPSENDFYSIEDFNSNSRAIETAFAEIDDSIGSAGGLATLDASKKLTASQLPAAATQSEAQVGTSTTVRSWTPQRVAQAVRGGILTGLSVASSTVITATDTVLIAIGKLQAQITAFKAEKGAAGGLATLDNAGKVPSVQLPAMNYIPTSEKAAPNGVATLDSSGNLAQLPVAMGRVYTTLEQLGLSDADMSADDFEGNLRKLIDNMLPGSQSLIRTTSNITRNLNLSVAVWINAAGNSPAQTPGSATYTFSLIRFADTVTPNPVEVYQSVTTANTTLRRWWAIYDDGLSLPQMTWGQVQIMAGKSTTGTGWFKIASVAYSSTSTTTLGFSARMVRHAYYSATQRAKNGSFKVAIRASNTAVNAGTGIYWEYANTGIDTNDLMLAYKINDDATLICEVWLKNIDTNSWDIIDIDWAKENHQSSEAFGARWSFYNRPTPVAAIPYDLTQIPSTVLPLHLPEATGKVYTTLEQLGLSDEDMDSENADANFYKIIVAMAEGSMFHGYAGAEKNMVNFRDSVVRWLLLYGADPAIDSGTGYFVKLTKSAYSTVPNDIEILRNGSGTSGLYKWWAKYDNVLSVPQRIWGQVQIRCGMSSAGMWHRVISFHRTTSTHYSSVLSAKIARQAYGNAVVTKNGRFKVAIRGNNTTVTSAQIRWEYANAGINLDDFVIAYKVENNVSYFDVWIRNLEGVSQDVIDIDWAKGESGDVNPFSSTWRFYDNPTPVEAIPDDLIQIPSTLLPLNLESSSLEFHTNRSTSVIAADTKYTTVMARGIRIDSSVQTNLVNGTISMVY